MAELINNLQNNVMMLGPLAPVGFFLFYYFVVLTGFSAAVLTVSAGVLFGLWTGYFLVVTSATLAAATAFGISRYLLQRFSKDEDPKFKNQLVQKVYDEIDNRLEDNGFVTIATLRLLFFPYIPLSYAAGLVKHLKFRDFIVATFVTNLFGSFVFIFLGTSFSENFLVILIAILLVISFSQMPKIIAKYKYHEKQ